MRDGNDKPLILIVDDQAEYVWPLATLLSDDMRSVVATDSRQVLEKLAEQAFDLILLDIEMPFLDGFAICRQIKNNPASADIPVIFVTARVDETAEEQGFAIGAVDYVHKPYQPALIRARIRTHLRLHQQGREWARRAQVDALTGLANRRAIDGWMAGECRRSDEHGLALSLLLVDLDHFKQVNDRFGHLAGDDVLRKVGLCLGTNTRSDDLVGRWGGEEFVVLSRCALEGARLLAQRIQGAIAALDTGLGTVTASIGVGMQQDGETALALFDRVDRALRLAKEQGRNRVVAAP